MRMQAFDARGVRLINDAYNANPSSMAASLTSLFMSPSRTKVAVLGDMLELGEASVDSHRNVGRLAGSGGLSFLVVMGEFAAHVAEGAVEAGMDPRDILVASGYGEAAFAVMSRINEGDVVLVKGSRGMRLEEVANRILEGRRAA
jgi:UDP-N-acetylmuramoyl-tripeptide--D-alanyl-D-alanine ligase